MIRGIYAWVKNHQIVYFLLVHQMYCLSVKKCIDVSKVNQKDMEWEDQVGYGNEDGEGHVPWNRQGTVGEGRGGCR